MKTKKTIIKYCAHDKGYDPVRTLHEAYFYDSIEECKKADEEEFSKEEIEKFEYLKVTIEVLESE